MGYGIMLCISIFPVYFSLSLRQKGFNEETTAMSCLLRDREGESPLSAGFIPSLASAKLSFSNAPY